jgi:hypothetical protein
MSRYNVYPEADFSLLIQRDPRLIIDLMLEVAESSRQHPDSAYIIPFTSIPPIESLITPDQFGWLFAGENDNRNYPLPSMATVQTRIEDLMPFASDLSWKGYVAAGSFAALVCQPTRKADDSDYMPRDPGDVDFYPYCSPEDRGNFSMIESAMVGYRQFLDDMTAAINDEPDTLDRTFTGSITKRNTNCTTISVEVNNHGAKSSSILTEYQIIHRAHTSPTSVVVGFDQMACKAFYDGEMVYFTLDAALCLYFGINPVDWRRESPSHLRRVDKYKNYGYTPIFPGLKSDLLFTPVNRVNSEIQTGSFKRSYYLPGCLLVTRTHKTGVGKTQKTHRTVELSFDNYGLNLYCEVKAGLRSINELQQYEREEIDTIKINCPNIESVPQVPFSREASESDYSADTTNSMAHAYHVLSMAIRDKFVLMSVYNEDAPNEIIDNAKGIDVRSILKKLLVGHRSDFYFGTDRVHEIEREMSRLVLTNHGGSIAVKLMNKGALQQLTNLQAELTGIFDSRVAELERIVQPQIAKLQAGVTFITSNPGAQFTASFKPIIRQQPQDYWGCLYTPTKPSRLRQIKLTLLCIKKYHWTTLSLLDKNIIKMLFGYIDMAYFRCETVEPYIVDNNSLIAQLHEVPAAATVLFSNPSILARQAACQPK